MFQMSVQVNPVSTAVPAITLETPSAAIVKKVFQEKTVETTLWLVITSILRSGLQIVFTEEYRAQVT